VKKSDLIRIIREELKTLVESEQTEKVANTKAAQADLEAKKIALKNAQDKLNKTKSQVV